MQAFIAPLAWSMLLVGCASAATTGSCIVEAGILMPREVFLGIAISMMIGCGLTSFLLAGRASERTHVALAMLIVLIGTFCLLTFVDLTADRQHPVINALVILGLIGLFKLLNQFEIRRKTGRSGD
jgi:hypothetical protein